VRGTGGDPACKEARPWSLGERTASATGPVALQTGTLRVFGYALDRGGLRAMQLGALAEALGDTLGLRVRRRVAPAY
jgi:hypothetical protein